MKPLGVGMAFVLVVLLAAPARPQTPMPGDLSRFLKLGEDNVRAPASTDWDDLLYAEAKSGRSLNAVLAGFAARIGVSAAVGREYAWVIMQSILYSDVCAERPVDPGRCVFAPGQSHFERVASIARRDRTGRLLIAVGKNVRGTLQDEAGFFTLAGRHHAARAIFARLFELRRDPEYLLALAGRGHDDRANGGDSERE
jgi:hypothetical protein